MEKKLNHGLERPSMDKLRRFGLSFSLGMAILFLVSIWRDFILPVKIIIAFLCGFHLSLALFKREWLSPSFAIVSFVGKIVGIIITTVLFTVVFYLLFTPIAWLLRLAKKDLIKTNSASPQWVAVGEGENDPKRIERMY